MSQPFVHLELNTPDLAKAKAFYSGLFGWTFDDQNMGSAGTYSLFKAGEGPGGGMFTMPGAPTEKTWLPYVGVEDLKVATDKGTSLGATVIMREQVVPGHGVFSILVDPTGAPIALWQATSKQ